jgi:hypothetical protein
VSPLEVGGRRDHLGMTDQKPDEPEDGDEQPKESKDERPEAGGPKQDVGPELDDDEPSSGAIVLNFTTSNIKPFAGFDVGKMPIIDYSNLLPKFDFSGIVNAQMQPFLDSIAKLDFGFKPVLDAAVLKSLGSLTPPLLPEGFFDKLIDVKFPELYLHPDTLRMIDSLTVPPRSRELDRVDDVLEAELVDDEDKRGTELELPSTIPEQQLAMQQRMVELLEQSIAANAQSNERADDAQARAERADERAARADERAEAATKRGNTTAVVSIIIAAMFGIGAIVTAIIVG